MTRGHVVYVTPNGAMLVVEHETGFSWVELLGSEGEVERGHLVYGNWEALGGDTIRHDGEEIDVFMQGCWGSLGAVMSVLGH